MCRLCCCHWRVDSCKHYPHSSNDNTLSVSVISPRAQLDAVLWLKQTLWPLIQQHLIALNINDAELHIYGAYPPKKASQLDKPKQGFCVKGWAADAYEVMRGARVNLAPLRFGAGLKGKLVDAMACGTPSISTTIGAEGMAGQLPWCGAITDEAEAFAAAAAAHYCDQALWQRARQHGLPFLSRALNQRARRIMACRCELNLLYAADTTPPQQFLRHYAAPSQLPQHPIYEPVDCRKKQTGGDHG